MTPATEPLAPQNLDAEESVLGAMLISRQAVDAVQAVLGDGAAFYWKSHRLIYRAAVAVHSRGVTPDPLLVIDEIERRGQIAEVGAKDQSGADRVHELAAIVPAVSNAGHWAELIARAAIRRRQLRLLKDGIEHAHNGGIDSGWVDQMTESIRVELVERAPAAIALSLDEFIAETDDAGDVLLGTTDAAILPAGGLCILAGKPGVGKTTLALDAALHFATGIDWLTLPVSRPLRVLFLENEGPRGPFRRKLARKHATWPHHIGGEIHFPTRDAWGAVSIADPAAAVAVRAYIDNAGVDLIIGDPLTSLGVTGVGSPEDTRNFIALLQLHRLLGADVAWIILHHFRKEKADDPIDELSGAWAAHADAIALLKPDGDNRAILSWPKLRWAPRRQPAILEFDAEHESFTYLCDATSDGEERDLAAELEGLLADGTPRTTSELSDAKKGGIGKNRDAVREVLEARPEMFRRVDPKAVGRSANAKVWTLARASEQVGQDPSAAHEPLDLLGPPVWPVGPGGREQDGVGEQPAEGAASS